MTKMVLITAALIAGIGFAVAQGQVPGNKSEAATPAPPAQQNAPPDKVTPGCGCSKLKKLRKASDFRATAIPSWA
jgi:hypothetical protein